MSFFAVILKNVLRRRVRSLLTTLGIALSVAAAVALVSFSRGLENSATEVYGGHGIDLMVVRAGVTERLTSSLNGRIGEQLRSLAGVAEVNPSLTDMVSFGEGSLIGIPVHGWPVDSFALAGLRMDAGRLWFAADRRPVLVGQTLARTLHKQVGDRLDIEGQPFTVTGIFAGANTFEDATAVVPLADLQQLMDRPDQVTEFQIKLTPEIAADRAAVDALCRRIATVHLPGGQRSGLAALPTQDYITSSTEVRLAHAMAGVTSLVALVIGVTATLNTMIMSVLERTQEIAVLRAVGWRKFRVARMIVGESLLLSLAGGILGLALAWLLVRGLSQTAFVQGILRAELAPRIFAQGLAVTIAIGLIGGIYPALRAARLPLSEALRYE
jgi:putative ABC transport system permease protein